MSPNVVGIIAVIVTFILAIVASRYAHKYGKAKQVVYDIANILENVEEILSQKKATPKEVQQIISDIKNIVSLFKEHEEKEKKR